MISYKIKHNNAEWSGMKRAKCQESNLEAPPGLQALLAGQTNARQLLRRSCRLIAASVGSNWNGNALEASLSMSMNCKPATVLH